MTTEKKRPSGLVKFGFKVPVWLYRAHLGFIFGGRIFAVVHHGRKSGKRYVSGLEVLLRRDSELFVFSAWGTKADWFRNIEAGGVDELWDGHKRYSSATFHLLDPDETYAVLEAYEQQHPGTAKRTLPRMLDDYDFSDEKRRELAEIGTIVAFRPSAD
jgi:deazaflavin-dependent oxidoreductase (nitroreductase family)